MKANVGGADKIIRVVAGLVILGLGFTMLEGDARYWGLVGLVPLATGLFNFCPAYTLFGMSTAKK